jgi:coenzyme PQQ precursor peptide PqqA
MRAAICTLGQVTARAGPVRLFVVKGANTLFRKRAFWREPMSWTTPVVVEICAGLEVTAYVSAEM